MLLGIGNDHTAYELKLEIIKHLEERGIEYKDYGAHSRERANYPTYGELVGEAVAKGEVDGGILICGTGVGISLAANKIKGVRACVCSEPYTAKLSKQHNNSNIIAFGARVVGVDMAIMIVDAWIDAEHESGGRHSERVAMISQIEEKNFK